MNKQDYKKNKEHWDDVVGDAKRELKKNHNAFVAKYCPIKVDSIIENDHARIHVQEIKVLDWASGGAGEVGDYWGAVGPKLTKEYELPKTGRRQNSHSTEQINFPTNFETNEKCNVRVVKP